MQVWNKFNFTNSIKKNIYATIYNYFYDCYISVIFLAWSFFMKVPMQYRSTGVFELASQNFLASVTEDDRIDLIYLRKALMFFSTFNNLFNHNESDVDEIIIK